MSRNALLPILIICWILFSIHSSSEAELEDLLSRLDRLVSLAGSSGDRSAMELSRSVADDIETSPTLISKVLVEKCGDRALTEKQQMVYAWALGITKDPSTTSTIVQMYHQSKSDNVQENCLRALAVIGGKGSGDFLMSVLETTTDKEKRFGVLNLLAEMQHEPALSKGEEILAQDPKTLYWQTIFFFGKMGHKAVPFLLERINHKNHNVRVNTLYVLGFWLIPLEAGKPLQEQFWIEKDENLRLNILAFLERTMDDLPQVKAFFEEVVAREKEEKVLQYARETLASLSEIAAAVALASARKKPSADAFQLEYTKIFKSAGKEGDLDALEAYSTVQDEPRLRALRERILQRNSDESFYEYQDVNNIIILNRILAKVALTNQVQP